MYNESETTRKPTLDEQIAEAERRRGEGDGSGSGGDNVRDIGPRSPEWPAQLKQKREEERQ